MCGGEGGGGVGRIFLGLKFVCFHNLKQDDPQV